MLTVMVGFDGSGNSSTLRPLARRYSVMPSTVVTRVTPAGNWAPAFAGVTAGAGGAASATARAKQVSRGLRFMVFRGSAAVNYAAGGANKCPETKKMG